MHLRTLPTDRPLTPPARRPVQRDIREFFPAVLWLATMVIIAIGIAT